MDFHGQIARLGNNKFLVAALMQVYEQTRVALPAVFMTPMIPRFRRDHVAIFEALQALDGAHAKRLIRAHERATLELLDLLE